MLDNSGLILYLLINGFSYILLGFLCLIRPVFSANLVGYRLDGQKGFSEFSAVYGGLELGIGVFYLIAATEFSYQVPALIFSLALYGGIVGTRIISLLVHGSKIGFVALLFALETSMLLWAILIYLNPLILSS